jgi:hypothetical protein
MNESDYSIRPLQGPPTVTGLNPAGSSEEQKKRQNSRKRPGMAGGPVEVPSGGMDEHAEDGVKLDSDQPHIDYRA